MKVKIMILNVMKYEKDGKVGSRIGYIFPSPDNFQDTEKFKGFSELSSFRSDSKFYDEVPRDFIGQICECTIEDKPHPTNPMRLTRQITSLTYNDKSIYLV